MNEPKGRFAPTPSGRMHLGNVFSAMIAWLNIKSQNGTFILRIEDLDLPRCPQENTDQIKEDLKWLGFTWDSEMKQQSQKTNYYDLILAELKKKAEIYPCWCTRGDLKNVPNAPHASDGHPIYPGTCRKLTPEERIIKSKTKAPIYRIYVPDKEISFNDKIYGHYTENLKKDCGDFILKRADGVYAYQLAVVADDIEAGITEVVRGRDLITSTARQIYLYNLLNEPVPSYMHIPMLTDINGRKLSKRDQDLDIGILKEKYKPEQILGILAYSSGIIDHNEPVTLNELIKEYKLESLTKDDIKLKIKPAAK